MGLLTRSKRDPNVWLVALGLASGVPLAAYLATASFHGYWLDAGEFTAQAVHLDVAHPPGHPLAGLLGRLLAFFPLGPLPLRVAVGQALCVAAAAGFLFAAIDTTVRMLGIQRDRLAVPLALGGTWCVACSYAWWFQAVRPEVYGLQALLIAMVIERVVHLEAAWPTLDLRPCYVAAFVLGLGLANHHLAAFLTMPALAPTMARIYRARGGRALGRSGLALAAGLSTYLYLPLRAATDPPANLGDPTNVPRFLWVLSARVYQQNKGLEAPQPLFERLADVVVILVDTFPFVVLVLAAAGLYALVRTAGARRVGYVWGALLLFTVSGPAWLMSVRDNPDVLGYMMVGLGAVGALAVAFVAAVLARIERRADGAPKRLATALAFGVAALGLASLRASVADASLASFHATDDFDEERVRRLPPNAVVVAHQPQTVFRHWAAAASEGARPDVTLVPMPFLNYPGVVEALAARDPDVAELLRGYLLHGELRQPDLQSLAARRPLLVEMDTRVPRELYETLIPAGLYFEVVDAGATDTDVLEAAQPHQAVIARLYTNLGDPMELEAETRNQLVWIHYMDALYFAAVGAREPARLALDRALAISPRSRELRGLAAALEEEGEGSIDVSPFVVGP